MKKICFLILLLIISTNIFAGENKQQIVVMNFYYKDISEKDMSSFTGIVTEALINTKKYDVMKIEERNSILASKRFNVETCLDGSCQAKAANALNVELYLAGDIGRLGNKYILHGAIIEAKTGNVVLQYDKIYDDFIKMNNDMKIFTYELCRVDPKTMPQDNVKIVEKNIIIEKQVKKMSKKSITSLCIIGAGGAAVIVGGIFLFDANNYYIQTYKPAYDKYNNLTVPSGEPDFSKAFNDAETGRKTFINKLVPGIVVAGAGVVTILAGTVIGLIPEKKVKALDNIGLSPEGLSFHVRY